MLLYVAEKNNEIFFLPSSIHREINKKNDLSFGCFLKLLMEIMLNVNIWRHGCLLSTENLFVGLGKGHVAIGDCCTFALVLVTYTPCGGNHQRCQDIHQWELLSPFAVSRALQRLLSVLCHWLNFLPDDVPGVCYDLLFIFSSCFSPLLFLIFWFSLTGTQEFLSP